MLEGFNPIRYSVIHEKNKREIVMLIGRGCSWRRCRFCDYHLDFDSNKDVSNKLNKEVLSNVTGVYGKLEVINSGSFVDLEDETMDLIEKICIDKDIKQVHFENHWNHREENEKIRRRFKIHGIDVVIKCGVETFDKLYRESFLVKGIEEESAEKIAKYFDEVCLLQGIPGQSEESMKNDIETALKNFKRVCINIMQENGKPVKPDPKVIEIFKEKLFPLYINNDRVDILMENTAFGVGGTTTE